MQKLVFLGYPTGYKGWKFWDLTSKRSIICERADFDERYFPARKDASPIPIPSLVTPLPVSESVPSQGERMLDVELDTDSDDPLIAPVVPASPRISPSPSVEQQSPTPAVSTSSTSSSSCDSNAPPPSPAPRHIARERCPPGEWWNVHR